MGFVLGQHLVYSSDVATHVQLGEKLKVIILPIQSDPNVVRFSRTQTFVMLKAAAINTALVELIASRCANVRDGPKIPPAGSFHDSGMHPIQCHSTTIARNATTIRASYR
jgi:hypothetical protein